MATQTCFRCGHTQRLEYALIPIGPSCDCGEDTFSSTLASAVGKIETVSRNTGRRWEHDSWADAQKWATGRNLAAYYVAIRVDSKRTVELDAEVLMEAEPAAPGEGAG